MSPQVSCQDSRESQLPTGASSQSKLEEHHRNRQKRYTTQAAAFGGTVLGVCAIVSLYALYFKLDPEISGRGLFEQIKHPVPVGSGYPEGYDYEKRVDDRLSEFLEIPRFQQPIFSYCGSKREPSSSAEGHKAPQPWSAAILVRNASEWVHRCGGVFITQLILLTAAHCVLGLAPSDIAVVSQDLSGSTEKAEVLKAVIHPDFDNYPPISDLAILHLAVTPNAATRQPICLPNANFITLSSLLTQDGTFLSWGSSSDSSAHVGAHMAFKMQILEAEVCQEIWGRSLSVPDYFIQFCARILNEGDGPCELNAGSPIMVEWGDSGNPHRWYLAGILSYTKVCKSTSSPYVFINTITHYPWISDTVMAILDSSNTGEVTQTKELNGIDPFIRS